MLVEINGESRDVAASITLAELITHLSLAPERLAVELNKRVVRRSAWQQTTVNEGDHVEIVHFVGGGMKDSDK